MGVNLLSVSGSISTKFIRKVFPQTRGPRERKLPHHRSFCPRVVTDLEWTGEVYSSEDPSFP